MGPRITGKLIHSMRLGSKSQEKGRARFRAELPSVFGSLGQCGSICRLWRLERVDASTLKGELKAGRGPGPEPGTRETGCEGISSRGDRKDPQSPMGTCAEQAVMG